MNHWSVVCFIAGVFWLVGCDSTDPDYSTTDTSSNESDAASSPDAAATDTGAPDASTADTDSSDADDPAPFIDLMPARLDFGEVRTGEQAFGEVQVFNRGDAPLTLSRVEVRGSTDLSIEDAPLEPVEVPPGDSLIVTFGYAAGLLPAEGVGVFFSDDPNLPAESVSLSGHPVSGRVMANPERLDFGSVEVGSSESRMVVISNEGDSTLDLTSAGVEGSAGFSLPLEMNPPLALNEPTRLEPGEQLTLVAVYTPTGAASDEGALIVESDDPRTPRLEVAMAGESVFDSRCYVEVTPELLDFGTVEVGEWLALPATVRNIGESPCRYDGAEAVGILNEAFSLGEASLGEGALFQPGQEMTVEVKYHPTGFDQNNGQLAIHLVSPSTGEAVLCNAGARCANGTGSPIECDLSPPPDCNAQLTGVAE